MTPSTFADLLTQEVAALQATFPALAEGLSRAHALVVEGAVFPEEDGRSAMVRSSTDTTVFYPVNGSCPCQASQHRDDPCKHRLAFRLYQRVCDSLAAEDERWTVATDADGTDPAAPEIPAHYLTTVQGRPFITFEGVLSLAHARGLVSLDTTVVQGSTELAVCQSTARFKDGLVCTDIGDASPTNVARHLAPHFIRMAATCASARALRRARNVSACAVEEFGEDAAA